MLTSETGFWRESDNDTHGQTIGFANTHTGSPRVLLVLRFVLPPPVLLLISAAGNSRTAAGF